MSTGIKKYDYYRKAIDGLQVKTTLGGIISVISGSIIIILTVMQTISYIKIQTSATLTVESQLDNIIPTIFDISLLQMPCDSFDIHFENTKTKQPTNIITDKTPLESSSGVPNSGCRIHSTFDLFPGEGNFHIALSRATFNFGLHSHMYGSDDLQHFNCSHIIHRLAFGDVAGDESSTLDEYKKNTDVNFNHVTYFVKLIPVEQISLHGNHRRSYQYSVTEYQQLLEGSNLFSKVSPGVFFKYQLTPIRITYTQHRSSFIQFYTTLLSIVGGVITVSGIVQSLLRHTIMPVKLD